jgi:hypothetical protein
MDNVCYICGCTSQEQELNPISGQQVKFVCNDDLEKHLNFQREFAFQDNEICKICLINQPTFISITEVPFQKYCNTCACLMFRITPGGPSSEFFIPIEWKKIVKNKESLEEYKKLRAKIKIVKNKCRNFKQSFDNSMKQLQLTQYAARMFPAVESYFTNKIRVVQNYKAEYQGRYKDVLRNIKESIIAGNNKNNDVVSKFLKNQRVFDMMDSNSLVKAKLNLNPDTIKDENFYNIQFKPLNELIHHQHLVIFFEEKEDIFEFSPNDDQHKLIRYKEYQYKYWKNKAFWASFENGDVLYTGGSYNRKPCGNCFLVNPREKLMSYQKLVMKRHAHTITTFNDVAYIFGGETLINDQIMQTLDNEKFIHKNNQWEKITSSPERLGRPTSAFFKEEIFLTGNKISRIFVYNIRKNCFAKEDFNIKNSGEKLLLRVQGELVLLVGSDVLLFDNTKNIFQKIGESNEKFTTSVMEPRMLSNQKVYWLTIDGNICSFNMATKKCRVEMLKSEIFNRSF